MNFITSYCHIESQKVFLNGQPEFEGDPGNSFSEFIKEIYKTYQLNYPKFYKMDNLSKLALITFETLLKSNDFISRYPREDIAIIISNSSSSLDTDIKHQDTISYKSSYFPNPSIFVYTLPNIMIGELCIKHSITGENILFVSEQFDPEFHCNFVQNLFLTNKAQCCITGWVNILNNEYKSFLCLVEKNKEGTIFNSDNLSRIYNTHDS